MGIGLQFTLDNALEIEREFDKWVTEQVHPVRNKLVVKSMKSAVRKGIIKMSRVISTYTSIKRKYIRKTRFFKPIFPKTGGGYRQFGAGTGRAQRDYHYAAWGWKYKNHSVTHYNRFKSSPGGPSSGGFGTRYQYFGSRKSFKTGFTHTKEGSATPNVPFARLGESKAAYPITALHEAVYADKYLTEKGRAIAEGLFVDEYRKNVEQFVRKFSK